MRCTIVSGSGGRASFEIMVVVYSDYSLALCLAHLRVLVAPVTDVPSQAASKESLSQSGTSSIVGTKLDPEFVYG